MKRVVCSVSVVAIGLLAAACGNKKAGGSNPIDVVMEKKFADEGIVPQEASREELCHRLSADLLGHYLAADEAAAVCGGSASEIVSRMQARPEYLRVSERVWRDRMDTSDINVDWRYLKDLYAEVDRLHQGKSSYKDFAIVVMSHPGFIESAVQPEDKVKIVYKAFLGRSPTATEAADLSALYRPWIPAAVPDPDFPYVYSVIVKILPALCDPLTTCTTTALGGGQLDLSGFADPQYQGIPYEDLTEAQLSAIREPGRVFTAQSFFWEAGADEILNRYLGWSDGGRFPREPGIVLPEVREALAQYLEKSNSYRDAERVVLSSWLYRQSAVVEDDGLGDDPTAPVPKVYAHGPVKPADAEVWLDSTAALTLPLGACDARYSDGFSYFLILQAIQNGMVSNAQGYTDIRTLYDLREDQMPWDETQKLPDFTYTSVARILGGCPGFQSQRQPAAGLSYAFTQEAIAELICTPGTAQHLAPPGVASPTLDQVLTHQMRITFGRDPLDSEKAAFATAKNGCSGADCTGAGLQNAVCVGLLGSAEMVFY